MFFCGLWFWASRAGLALSRFGFGVVDLVARLHHQAAYAGKGLLGIYKAPILAFTILLRLPGRIADVVEASSSCCASFHGSTTSLPG